MKNIFLLLCIFPLLSGCATVVTGTAQKVPVTSEPSEANVNVNGKENHITPVTLKLSRRMSHILIISKEGFKTAVVKIVGKLNPIIVGEFAVPGGSVLAGVDVLSGAAYDLKPEKVNVVLILGQDEELITYERELEKEKAAKIKNIETVYNFQHR